MALIIGINSGSSFDGVDVVLAEISMAEDGSPARPKYIDGLSSSWPEEVAKRVLASFNNEVDVFELCRLNYIAGAVFAEAAKKLMDKNNLKPEDVTVIGIDGQTVYQEPPNHEALEGQEIPGMVSKWLNGPYGCQIQIGESAVIAAHTGVTTVNNFRPSDQALGGTGAPLMQYLDYVAFRDIGPVLTLNIGGIANCQLANKDRSKMQAFDTGPGNVMLDHAAKKLFDIPFDANGSIAAKGKVSQDMLDELMQHPFLQRKPPRSAWRLDFGADYAEKMLDKYSHIAKEDVMATLCAFTANCIVKSINDNINDLSDVTTLIASGGGVKNPTLMQYVRDRMPSHIKVIISDELGIPAQYKEAIKFATLAYATINQLANNIPAASGASSFTVMGKVVYPPRLAKV